MLRGDLCLSVSPLQPRTVPTRCMSVVPERSSFQTCILASTVAIWNGMTFATIPALHIASRNASAPSSRGSTGVQNHAHSAIVPGSCSIAEAKLHHRSVPGKGGKTAVADARPERRINSRAR